MRSYEAARSLYGFLGFCSWCVIIAGVLVAVLGAKAAGEMSSFGGPPSGVVMITGLAPGLGIAFVGFLGLAMVQNGRAVVDTAEYSQQMLKIARDQLEVSQRALRQGNDLAQSFVGMKPSDDIQPDDRSVSFADDREPEPETPAPETLAPEAGGTGYQPGDTLRYRGKIIKVVEAGYNFGGRVFPTLEKAQVKIDEYGMFLPPKPSTPPPYADQLGVAGGPKLGGVTRPDGSS